MTNCPVCNVDMRQLPGQFMLECPKCGKRISHSELLQKYEPPTRRIVSVPIPSSFIRESCLEEPESPENIYQFKLTNGLPLSCKYIASTFDPMSMIVNLFFEDDSFDPVPDSCRPPSRTLEFFSTKPLNIPEEYKKKILWELDKIAWDKPDDHSGLWILLNKLKESCGFGLDEYMPCKWSDLDKPEEIKE